jgi:lysophospholipase L1-like esterase
MGHLILASFHAGERLMRRSGFGAAFCCLLVWGMAFGEEPKSPFAQWESAIAAFEKEDAKSRPPKGAVLFVGSSSIRLWKLDKSFPNLTTINRGFGGSQIADSVHFADRIVTKHEPRTVVLYAGDNDLAKGKSPEEVAKDFGSFVKVLREKLPGTKILYIGIKPSIKRWNLIESVRKANSLINEQCQNDERLVYVDPFPAMLGEDGKPRPELFVKDGLHLSEAGYEVWTKLLMPHLPKPDTAKD